MLESEYSSNNYRHNLIDMDFLAVRLAALAYANNRFDRYFYTVLDKFEVKPYTLALGAPLSPEG